MSRKRKCLNEACLLNKELKCDNPLQHRKDFNTFVLFTDGYASTRGLRPVPNVLWIITSNGNRNNSYLGKTIFIQEEVKGH